MGSQYRIALIGSHKETDLEQEFLNAFTPEEQQRINSYIAKTTLPQLLGIIQSFDLLVTGDTGPLHLAIALKTRTISLFYTANPKHTGPYQDSELHHILSLERLPEPCSPQEQQWPLALFKAEEVLRIVSQKIKWPVVAIIGVADPESVC